MKLDGHEHPLIGVNCLPNLDCFVTADSAGMFKLWNIVDYSCIQTFYLNDDNEVKCFRAVPKHRRLICGTRNFTVFEYDKPFIPEFTDDKTVCCALFSEKRLEIFVAGEKSIKVWDARSGKPIRVIKNVFDSDITQMIFDEHHRKLIVGSHESKLKVYDLQSGIMTL
jgi:WD40 repeat protein